MVQGLSVSRVPQSFSLSIAVLILMLHASYQVDQESESDAHATMKTLGRATSYHAPVATITADPHILPIRNDAHLMFFTPVSILMSPCTKSLRASILSDIPHANVDTLI